MTAHLWALLECDQIGGRPIPGGRQVAELLAEVMVREALKGKFRFMKEILERVDGKVPAPSPGGAEPVIPAIVEILHWPPSDRPGLPPPSTTEEPEVTERPT